MAIGRAWPAREERRDREQHAGFVPVASMPAGLRWFAENQPFTPITDTVRSLLANQHVGSAGVKAIVWCLAITAASYLWARYLYNRRPVQ
jgi:ABC-2 type transport system permease protein